MANHSSAQKALRQTIKNTERNKSYRSKVRTSVRNMEVALEKKDGAQAKATFTQTTSLLMKAVGKGILSKNLVARKISRMSKKVKALES